MNTTAPTDEFWWLPDGAAAENLFVYVGHDPPVKDEVEPCEKTWYFSVDGGEPSTKRVLYPTSFLLDWKNRWVNQNVHRSLILYTSGGEPVIEGPFLVDIDNEAGDLADTLHVARRVEEYFSSACDVPEDGMRVYFSGRKGFHVEVAPSAIEDPNWRSMLRDVRTFVRGTHPSAIREGYVSAALTAIDPQHECVRLAGSVNAWLADDGGTIRRRKIQISAQELHNATIDHFVRRSEVVAGPEGDEVAGG